ncbi:Uncharacterized protein APZ42_028657 [Daphnia magna]|uniref:Uncharacterized protein n=1 Tax=Daphnia magna TaxID=35525 RepID=A0A0P6C4Q8_9CRUS|nr:Uncharacterized protein APZ42_028657 [Daphnia magna]
MIAGIVRAAVIFYNNKGGGRELEEQTTAQKERKKEKDSASFIIYYLVVFSFDVSFLGFFVFVLFFDVRHVCIMFHLLVLGSCYFLIEKMHNDSLPALVPSGDLHNTLSTLFLFIPICFFSI